jgi:hypothetical protein
VSSVLASLLRLHDRDQPGLERVHDLACLLASGALLPVSPGAVRIAA